MCLSPLSLDPAVPSPPLELTPRLSRELQLGTLGLTLHLREEGVPVGPTAAVVVGFADVVPVREEPPQLSQVAAAMFRRLDTVTGMELLLLALSLA